TLRSVFQKKWYDRKVRCHKEAVEMFGGSGRSGERTEPKVWGLIWPAPHFLQAHLGLESSSPLRFILYWTRLLGLESPLPFRLILHWIRLVLLPRGLFR